MTSPGVSAFAIRAAGPADAGKISALLLDLLPALTADPLAEPLSDFRDSLGMPATRARLESPDFACLLAEDAQGVCGHLALRDGSHLYHLFVRADAQGRGIARALWQAVRANHDARRYTVNASLGAVGFYARLGFRASSTVQQASGLRWLPMALHVDDVSCDGVAAAPDAAQSQQLRRIRG